MLLGIDLGTSSVKALLLNLDGTVISEASSSYPVQAPRPGWAETNPANWWLAVAVAVQKAVEHRTDRVQAIALSGQMHGVVLIDGSGQREHPKVANCPQTISLGLYKQSRSLAGSIQSAQADLVFVAAISNRQIFLLLFFLFSSDARPFDFPLCDRIASGLAKPPEGARRIAPTSLTPIKT